MCFEFISRQLAHSRESTFGLVLSGANFETGYNFQMYILQVCLILVQEEPSFDIFVAL